MWFLSHFQNILAILGLPLQLLSCERDILRGKTQIAGKFARQFVCIAVKPTKFQKLAGPGPFEGHLLLCRTICEPICVLILG